MNILKEIKIPKEDFPEESQKYIKDDYVLRRKLFVDLEIPLFDQNKAYINSLID